MDGGDQESDGEMMAETDELTYECAPRQKHPILFDEPVALYVSVMLSNYFFEKSYFTIFIYLGKSMVYSMC